MMCHRIVSSYSLGELTFSKPSSTYFVDKNIPGIRRKCLENLKSRGERAVERGMRQR